MIARTVADSCCWNSFNFNFQAQFVGGFVHPHFDTLQYGMRISQRRQCATGKCVLQWRLLGPWIYYLLKYFVQRTCLSHVGENGLDKPVEGNFKPFLYFFVARIEEVWESVLYGLL